MAKLQCVRGTYDLYGAAKRKTKQVVRTGEEVVEKYGFEEIETPIFEFTEVFARNLGDTSDIVTKEMYCFEDRGGESLTLRPEGFARLFPTACSKICRSSFIITARCFVTSGRRKAVSVSLPSSGWNCSAPIRRKRILK